MAGGSSEEAEPGLQTSRLVICDTQPIFAQGFAQLVAGEAPEVAVTGIAGSVEELLEMPGQPAPDLVLLDARFGIDAAQPVFFKWPAAKVVLMATADHEVDLAGALAAGVAAYLRKEHGIAEIVQVLRLVQHDLLIVPAALARSALGINGGGQGCLAAVERQILCHIAAGATNRDIARLLNLSERTVRRRVIQLYGKLRVSDRVDAALWAERHGIRLPGGDEADSPA